MVSDEDVSTRLMLAMAFLEKPNRSTQEALEQIAHTPESSPQSRMAELSLGQMAYQVAEDDPGRARDIIRKYEDDLKQSENAKVVMQALNVIGNSGLCNRSASYYMSLKMSQKRAHSECLDLV